MPAERDRILEEIQRKKYWRRWGPYLAERAWGNPREDYSADGNAWDYFPFDQAALRAYRWTEDGIAGFCDNHQRVCFSTAFWNGRDPILKERLFGLGGNEGNHGEDVKEYYYYLDSTPSHSYQKALYKYPQAEFPYQILRDGNRARARSMPEFELIDTGIFDQDRYFDITIEYAKSDVNDVWIRVTAINRGPDKASLHLIPTVWFRNTWEWGHSPGKPALKRDGGLIRLDVPTLGAYQLSFEGSPELLFTENTSNTEKLWQYRAGQGFYKDAFHECIVHGNRNAVNPAETGTKACGWHKFDLEPGEQKVIRMRLCEQGSADLDADDVFAQRIAEADEFYELLRGKLTGDAYLVQRQAFAGLLWTKQFYHFVVEQWLDGDPGQPPPPPEHKEGRNREWRHLYNEDILSMPDKWEYPWYAAWDLAFHAVAFAPLDPDFSKQQLSLFLREWYMHPNGQIPAYEWAFSDVNPPVHAWACARVFKIDAKLQGKPDYHFLEAAFHKLLMNFTWWVNRKDSEGNNIFEGGFLGLDNVGVFDRSKPLPTGGVLEQADGTSWMAAYCLDMLRIALELTPYDSTYEDIASKFFEHFLFISGAINRMGDRGLWDETDGLYYDWLKLSDGRRLPLKVRSMVGLAPLLAVVTLENSTIDAAPGFKRRMEWFIHNREDLCANVASISRPGVESRRLLAITHKDRLLRVLATMLDEDEFLSPHGIRSLSRHHLNYPFVVHVDGHEYRVDYEPAESSTGVFGGNSNWRGPVWFPMNFLLIEALQRFHHYFGDELKVEYPTRSGNWCNLGEVAANLSRRLSSLFLRGADGRRPVFGGAEKFQTDPNFRDHILFYEYFHGDNGAGVGASHQTGWTALVAKLLQQSGV
ncbi:MAG TPA: hypothetical protein VHD76_23640 [Bryobacteraceae bacterium]|jgi:hypothetical protein|nr:hypothetical protein [Bryobacteraceae bacterium]